ncbi:MAG: MG2 domain-containing protein [Chitinophagaceae bacterium]|nr:MG2 domain-containing protein [Chitinophagaceae bacterium]
MKFLKHLLSYILSFFLLMPLKSQTKISYDDDWKKVDHLISDKKLPQSALILVQKIYEQAKKEKNQPQLIKALLYQIHLNIPLTENGATESIQKMESEIQKAQPPVRHILQSVTANMYWKYLQNNRWKFYNRTKTENISKTDPATWTLDDLHEKISSLYQASINDEKLLTQIRLENYEPIILKGNTRKLRPTLYDLLAHRALDYFENDEKDITKPAYAFTINENAAFDPVADFIHHSFKTGDSSSLHYKALLIFRQLLSFHSQDATPDALMDADLRRLQFVYRYATMPDKEEVYRQALVHLTDQYGQQPVTSRPRALLAAYYFQQGNPYGGDNGNEALKYALRTAKEICDATIASFPGTEGAADCIHLLNSIMSKSLSLQTEKINIPDEAFRTLVSYKNLSGCHFRVIQINRALKEQLENRYEIAYWNKLAQLPAIRTWRQVLPLTDDFRNHSVEIKIDPLPAGEYLLLGSINDDFTTAENLLAAQFFYVSNISYINNENTFFALHRNTGQPLSGASVQVWTSRYDYTDRKNKLQRAEKLTADNNGSFRLTTDAKNNRNNARLEIRWQKDYLFLDDYQYLYTRFDANDTDIALKDIEQTNARLYFFTDRSIYRPGQTVYFKGIGITKEAATHKAKTITGKPVKIYLRDVNQQTLDSTVLTLNDFGSLHGQFRIPQHVLTGNFSLYADDFNESTEYFSVEEYKRPKFVVTINKPDKSFRVNDTVTLAGSAKAYAGNSIDGARVKYRVSREARFFDPRLYYRGGFPRANTMEIINGTTTTDASGNFTIHFAAIPDHSISPSLDPVFNYTVEADVTDINGETRSSTAVIRVGHKAIQLGISLPQNGPVAADRFTSVLISSKNMNDEFEAVNAKVNIFPMLNPGRLIRNRYWEKPDQFLYTKEEYLKFFPHDEYKDESDYRNWEKGSIVYSDSLITSKNPVYQLPNLSASGIRLPEGWYGIEVTAKDRFGSEVKAVEYVQLYNNESRAIPSYSYAWSTGIAQPVEPGETASFLSGTSANNVFLIQHISRNTDQAPGPANGEKNTGNRYQFFTLNNEKKEFHYTATAEDRGGLGITQFFVKNNRFYTNNQIINIPWTNKQLDITYTTFRDKLEPGSNEKWEVKISGKNGEKAAAEMLASMYDASLDQFKPHEWNIPGIWPTYFSLSYWNGRENFSAVQSQLRNELGDGSGKKDGVFIKNYDRLLDTELPLSDEAVVVAYGMQKRSLAGAADAAVPASPRMETEQNKLQESASINPAGNDTWEDGASSTTTHVSNPALRKNFNETAFFFPDLKTDSTGNIIFSFTVPEALTQWKLMTLAHTPSLAFGYARQLAVTQKILMVQPNPPRFVREKDNIFFSAKVVNISDSLINGFAKLELFDAATNRPVDDLFHNAVPVKNFSVSGGQSTALLFQLTIPENFNRPLLYRVSATSSQQADGSTLSDGEENILPVLNNRMLVTDVLPLNMRGAGSKQFKFEPLLKQDTSPASTQKNYALTVEYSANPAWYAVQALPYLIEYPFECSEQTFNRYYANTLATRIANSAPGIKAMYEQWLSDSSNNKNLVSPLEKNEELKSILLQETPWVLQAQSETQQKQQIALLFDLIRMSNEAASNRKKLEEMQTSNGGFAWFSGGEDNRYITQYILTGIGHLQKLKALSPEENIQWNQMIENALRYTDNRIREDYEMLIKQKADLKKNNLTGIAIQYLYMRSFFDREKADANVQKAYQYYKQQAKQFWVKQRPYFQGMIALSLYRDNDKTTSNAILASLKENAIKHEEMGMYWKSNRGGYFWYEAPVETQALLIEAFDEITGDAKTVNEMKTWLLKQKQTQHWGNTRSTAEACYALLLQGTNWLQDQQQVTIQMGSQHFSSTQTDATATGYFKSRIKEKEISPEMGNIRVTVTSPSAYPQQTSASWGAVYWQYFEDLDKITASTENKMPLRLKKQIFIEKNSDSGPVLLPIDGNQVLKTGDKIKVRIELRADRDMEYVHMKDLRPSGTEPVNVLSQYKWQDGLGYYESTRDAATNFFFSWLQKGTYVFEYPLFVTHQGHFSSGVATIQCMYAPEFIAHSEGISITVH